MKPWITLFFVAVVILSSCTPTYQRLQAHETVLNLENGNIILVLDDSKEEAALFKSYGYEKRAARLQRADEKTESMFAEAILYFRFCPIEIQWASEMDNPSPTDSTFFMTVERQTNYRGEQQEEIVCLVLRGRQGEPLPAGFPSVQEIGPSISRTGLNFAMKTWEKRMVNAHANAVKAKSRNDQ